MYLTFMADTPAGNTWPPQNPDKPGILSRFRAWINNNKKFVYIPLLGLVLVIFGVWAKYDFTLDFSRFFAATQCNDGIDNDGDFKVDWDGDPPLGPDPGCEGPDDDDETDGPPPPGPSIDLKVNGQDGPINVPAGTQVTLSWSSEGTVINCNAASVPLELWTGSKSPNGNEMVTIDEPSVFTISCNAGSVADSTQVDIGEPSPEPTPTPTGTEEPPPTSCAKVNFVASVNTDGTATVKNNNNEPCTAYITTYHIWKNRGGTPPHYLQQQTIFETVNKRLSAGQQASVTVGVPTCYNQIDLTRVPAQQPPQYNSEDILAFNFGPFGTGYCDAPGPTPTPPVSCPATAPTGLNTTTAGGVGSPLVLRWTPGTGGTFQQLRFGSNQAEVNSGCQAVPTTCTAVEHNLPLTQNEYSIPASRLTAGTTYYWRVVNLYQGPPVCFKDAAATYLAPGSTPTPTPTPTPVSPTMTIVKTVTNVSQGGGEADLVSANPGETVQFTIRVTGQNGTVQNVQVSDVLPFGLTYVAGSTTVNGNSVGDGIVSGGISIGNLTSGQTATIQFRAQVLSASSFSSGITTLTNTATASASNAPTVSDTAFVNVTITQLIMSLHKFGRNITQGQTGENSIVNAKPNETIEFILRVKSLSAAQLNNVIVSDVIPTGLTYITGTTTVNGVVRADDIINTTGLNIGSLSPGQEAVVKFQVKAGPSTAFPIGNSTLINTAKARADGVSEIIAQLPIIIANGTVGGAGQVPTGTGESLLLALAVSVIITLMYVTYTRTAAFRRREVKSMIRHGRDDDEFDFKG